jgi:tRNA1(Val) A37 N6-methylase TrmN6
MRLLRQGGTENSLRASRRVAVGGAGGGGLAFLRNARSSSRPINGAHRSKSATTSALESARCNAPETQGSFRLCCRDKSTFEKVLVIIVTLLVGRHRRRRWRLQYRR